MSDATTSEQTEQLTNDLIAVIWPLLDKGATRDEIQCAVHNVLDSWEPLEGVVEQAADPFKPYAIYLARSGKHYDLPPEVGDDIVHYTHALLRAEEREKMLVEALRAAVNSIRTLDEDYEERQSYVRGLAALKKAGVGL